MQRYYFFLTYANKIAFFYNFFAFFCKSPASEHTSIQFEPRKTQPISPRQDQPRTTQDQPNTSQYQPIRLYQDQTRTKLIVSLGRRANRALLPRCVPRCARSRRAIRCETPCGTPLLRKPRRRAECSVSGEARSRSSALRLSLRSSLACSGMPRCALVPAHAPLRRSIFPRLSVRLRPVSLLASDFRRSRSPGSPPCSAAAQSRHYGRGGLYRPLGRMRSLMGVGSSTRPLAAAVLACRPMAFGACGAIGL